MVVAEAKVLGLLLGYSLSAEDYFREIQTQYDARIQRIRIIPMSAAMRITVLNIFVRSLLMYVARFVLIPASAVADIERRDLAFTTKVPYFAIGILSHLRSMYGINATVQDLASSNMAGLFSTARKAETLGSLAAQQLRASSEEQPTPIHSLRPSVMIGAAFGFYQTLTGSTVHTHLRSVELRRGNEPVVDTFRIVYTQMIRADASNWQAY